MTLEERITQAVLDADSRSYDECFYCGGRDCWHEVGDDLVCSKTGGRIDRDETKERAKFVTRAVLEVLKDGADV